MQSGTKNEKKNLKIIRPLNSFIIKPTVVTNPSSSVRTCTETNSSTTPITKRNEGNAEISANNITVPAEITPEINRI